jgi:hypothetical protein
MLMTFLTLSLRFCDLKGEIVEELARNSNMTPMAALFIKGTLDKLIIISCRVFLTEGTERFFQIGGGTDPAFLWIDYYIVIFYCIIIFNQSHS